ncbi:MAG: hypothetical protein V1709_11840 [Planctomycetota bacterium]
MDSPITWAIIGSVIGIIGALVGTYLPIRLSENPKEKKLMVKTAIVSWISVIVLIGLILSLIFSFLKPFNYFLCGLYVISVFLAIRYLIKKLREIRVESKTLR